MTPQEIYKAAYGELEMTMAENYFKMFIAHTQVGECTDDTIEIICPNKHTIDVITKKLMVYVRDAINRKGGEKYEITFKVEENKVENDTSGLPLFVPPPKKAKEEAKENPEESNLSPKYTFESFIVGPSNRLAHAVALAIAENPGKVYNPFFLHAGVGLGKTHLIQAIGHQVIKNNPKAKIVYATAESFMNELIEAIQEGRNKNYMANKFRNKFRKADVLLIDDIQFIAGRGEATQEEFFHTFNALYMSQRQIVLTSDRPPKELSKLDQRITSRFASGVIADMQKPDVETRSAILREKRDLMKAPISNEVVDYIAQSVETNIRELEGAFLQIITQAKAEGVDVTKELCARVLGQTLPGKANVNINDVLKTICNYYSIKMSDLKGPRRIKEFVIPRQVSMFLLKKYSGTPYMAVGDLLGRRDHTTIMHGAEKIEHELETNSKLKQDVANIKKVLNIYVD